MQRRENWVQKVVEWWKTSLGYVCKSTKRKNQWSNCASFVIISSCYFEWFMEIFVAGPSESLFFALLKLFRLRNDSGRKKSQIFVILVWSSYFVVLIVKMTHEPAQSHLCANFLQEQIRCLPPGIILPFFLYLSLKNNHDRIQRICGTREERVWVCARAHSRHFENENISHSTVHRLVAVNPAYTHIYLYGTHIHTTLALAITKQTPRRGICTARKR